LLENIIQESSGTKKVEKSVTAAEEVLRNRTENYLRYYGPDDRKRVREIHKEIRKIEENQLHLEDLDTAYQEQKKLQAKKRHLDTELVNLRLAEQKRRLKNSQSKYENGNKGEDIEETPSTIETPIETPDTTRKKKRKTTKTTPAQSQS